MSPRRDCAQPIAPRSVSSECRAKFLTAVAGVAALVALVGGPARPLASETLDRVVAAVGRTAITLSDVEAEYGVEYFLEHSRAPSAPPDRAALDSARDELIDRELIRRQAVAEGIATPETPSTAADQLTELMTKSGGERDFQAVLGQLGLTESEFAARLAGRQRTLELIDQFLRPQAAVSTQDVEAYYRQTFLPELAAAGSRETPRLTDVQNQIHEILVQKKINKMLPGWLDGLRANYQVETYGWE